MRHIMVLPALIAAAACGPEATIDQGSLATPDTVVLAIGGEPAGYRDLAVRFTEVPEDSRCPVDVTCVWEGNARVVLNTVVGGVERVVALNTTGDPEIGTRSIVVDGYRLTLLSLAPQPVSSQSIPEEEYRAELELAIE